MIAKNLCATNNILLRTYLHCDCIVSSTMVPCCGVAGSTCKIQEISIIEIRNWRLNGYEQRLTATLLMFLYAHTQTSLKNNHKLV